MCKVWFPFSVRTHQGEGASLPPRCRRGPSVWTSLEHPPLRLSPLPIECSGPLIFFMERCWGKVYICYLILKEYVLPALLASATWIPVHWKKGKVPLYCYRSIILNVQIQSLKLYFSKMKGSALIFLHFIIKYYQQFKTLLKVS